MTKLSVIIPVYNVENYLDQCVQSVLMQNMTDYEVILVNDGSKDSSGEKCDSYAEKYPQIHVIHKPNGGLSDARNVGVLQAQGEYLLFIDSDDFYDDATFFSRLVQKIEETGHPEIVNFTWKKYNERSGRTGPADMCYDIDRLERLGDFAEVLKALIDTDTLMISACSKAIRREFLVGNKLFFRKGIVGEDIEWAMRLLIHPEKMAFMQSAPYIYRCGRAGSITSSMGHKNMDDLFDIVSEYADQYRNGENICGRILLHYLAYQFAILCGLLHRVDDRAYRRTMMAKLKSYRWLLQYDLSPKVKKVAKLNSLIGLPLTVKILGLYIKYRS